MRRRHARHRSRFTPFVSGTVLRIGSAADHQFVAQLGARTLWDSVAPFRHADDTMLEASFDRLLQFVWEQSHVLLLALQDDRPVAFLLLLDGFPDEVTLMPQAFVAYMAVEPHHRRQGIATALLRRAEEMARERGLPYVALMVTENNRAAQRTYKAAGYLTERRLLCKPL